MDGRTVLSVLVGTGAPGTPTPHGHFYVTDRIRPPDPAGAYGPFALGLPAHSPRLQSFGDGDAQIGVHGTNEPSSVGHPVTHGCIRLSERSASTLAEVPLGTPVTIT
jgi:lipoprotein-anchoring transpeptidase ErfK/SrfK